VRLGSVVDFLDLRYWPFPFNLADSAIVLGAATLVAEVLRSRRRAPAEV
jgi:lipoprotein signal peptidase